MRGKLSQRGTDAMNALSIFTARCYAERCYATLSHLSVCLSVCDVQVS